MRRVLFAVMLVGLCFACLDRTSADLANSSMSLQYADCLFISDFNITINTSLAVSTHTTNLNYGECLKGIDNETFCAPATPNLNISIATNSTYSNAELNSTFFCEPPTRPAYSLISLAFGEVRYDSYGNKNYSCPVFPAINGEVMLTGNSNYAPSDSRYNLTVTSNCNQNTVWGLTYGQNATNAVCNITASCPAYPKENLYWNLTYGQTASSPNVNISCLCNKPKLNLVLNLTANETVNNSEWGIIASCPYCDTSRDCQCQNLTSAFDDCVGRYSLNTSANETLSFCPSKVGRYCTREEMDTGNLDTCINRTTIECRSELESTKGALNFLNDTLNRTAEANALIEKATNNSNEEILQMTAGVFILGMVVVCAYVYLKKTQKPAMIKKAIIMHKDDEKR